MTGHTVNMLEAQWLQRVVWKWRDQTDVVRTVNRAHCSQLLQRVAHWHVTHYRPALQTMSHLQHLCVVLWWPISPKQSACNMYTSTDLQQNIDMHAPTSATHITNYIHVIRFKKCHQTLLNWIYYYYHSRMQHGNSYLPKAYTVLW